MSKRKSKLGFPVEYYSNISPPIIKIFRHLACFICVLLINFGFKVCVDAIFNIDDKCVFISGLWFNCMSGNCAYGENTLHKYVTKRITYARSKMSNVWKRNNVLAAKNDEMTNRFTLSNLTADFTTLYCRTFLFMNCNLWAVFNVLEIFESHRRNSVTCDSWAATVDLRKHTPMLTSHFLQMMVRATIPKRCVIIVTCQLKVVYDVCHRRNIHCRTTNDMTPPSWGVSKYKQCLFMQVFGTPAT
jgi:hypothetical protein